LLSRPLASRALVDDMNFLPVHPASVNACATRRPHHSVRPVVVGREKGR